MMNLAIKTRVLSQAEPAMLVPPPGVGGRLCARLVQAAVSTRLGGRVRKSPPACATRSILIAQLPCGREKK